MSLHCLFFKNLRIKKEVINVHSQNTILIVVQLNDIFGNNDFLERIINLSEWSDFLSTQTGCSIWKNQDYIQNQLQVVYG